MSALKEANKKVPQEDRFAFDGSSVGNSEPMRIRTSARLTRDDNPSATSEHQTTPPDVMEHIDIIVADRDRLRQSCKQL